MMYDRLNAVCVFLPGDLKHSVAVTSADATSYLIIDHDMRQIRVYRNGLDYDPRLVLDEGEFTLIKVFPYEGPMVRIEGDVWAT